MELNLTFGEGSEAEGGLFSGVVEDYGGSAVDGVNHGIFNGVAFDSVPFSVGLDRSRIDGWVFEVRLDDVGDVGAGSCDGIKVAQVSFLDLVFERLFPRILRCSVFADAVEEEAGGAF